MVCTDLYVDISQEKKIVECPRYSSQNSKRSTSWRAHVRMPQSYLGGRRKQPQVGRERGTWEEKWMWDCGEGTWLSIGWVKETERKNQNRQPWEVGGCGDSPECTIDMGGKRRSGCKENYLKWDALHCGEGTWRAHLQQKDRHQVRDGVAIPQSKLWPNCSCLKELQG